MNSQNLNNLPKSILEQIFLNLNSHQILQSQLVNKNFREICKPLIFNLIDLTSWKGDLVEYSIKDTELMNIVKNYGKFATKFNCHYFDQSLPILKYLPHLASIYIKHGIEVKDILRLVDYTKLNTLGCLKFRNLDKIEYLNSFKYLTRLQLNIDLDLMCELVSSKVIDITKIEHLILEIPQLYIPLVNLITQKFQKLTKLVICSTNQSTSIKKENKLLLPAQNADLVELKECSIRIFYDFTNQYNEWLTRECLFVDYWLNYFKRSPLQKLNLKSPPIPEDFIIDNNDKCTEFSSNLIQLSSYKLPNTNTLKFLNLTNLTIQNFEVNYGNLSNLCELINLRKLTINLIKFESTIPHLPFTLDGCLKLNRLEFPYGHFELIQLIKLIDWFPNTKEFSCFTISSAFGEEEYEGEEDNFKNVSLPFEHVNIGAQTQSKSRPTLKLIELCKNLATIKLPKFTLTYLNYNKEGRLIRDGIELGDPLGIWFAEKYNDYNLIV
jgi:hypothetical protein